MLPQVDDRIQGTFEKSVIILTIKYIIMTLLGKGEARAFKEKEWSLVNNQSII